jgi:hypothetical protein
MFSHISEDTLLVTAVRTSDVVKSGNVFTAQQFRRDLSLVFDYLENRKAAPQKCTVLKMRVLTFSTTFLRNIFPSDKCLAKCAQNASRSL